ncbi:hypothetical protein ACKS0A_03501 [Histoplasma ohiense]
MTRGGLEGYLLSKPRRNEKSGRLGIRRIIVVVTGSSFGRRGGELDGFDVNVIVEGSYIALTELISSASSSFGHEVMVVDVSLRICKWPFGGEKDRDEYSRTDCV